jgi:hypothetical protein
LPWRTGVSGWPRSYLACFPNGAIKQIAHRSRARFLAARRELARHYRHHRIVSQLVVVVEDFILEAGVKFAIIFPPSMRAG